MHLDVQAELAAAQVEQRVVCYGIRRVCVGRAGLPLIRRVAGVVGVDEEDAWR